MKTSKTIVAEGVACPRCKKPILHSEQVSWEQTPPFRMIHFRCKGKVTP